MGTYSVGRENQRSTPQCEMTLLWLVSLALRNPSIVDIF